VVPYQSKEEVSSPVWWVEQTTTSEKRPMQKDDIGSSRKKREGKGGEKEKTQIGRLQLKEWGHSNKYLQKQVFYC